MSEWKEHDGGPQPEETRGRRVAYQMRDERREYCENQYFFADELRWPHRCPPYNTSNIIYYRLIDTPPSEEAKSAKTAALRFLKACLRKGRSAA